LHLQDDTPLFFGAKPLSDVSLIITEPCVSSVYEAWDYAAPPVSNLSEALSGIVVKTKCPVPEVILWFKDKQMAYWTNPYVTLKGLTQSVGEEHKSGDIRDALLDALSGVWVDSTPSSTNIPENGCVWGADRLFQRVCQ
nr:Chain B, Envelope glycoprotein L [Human herpesvirus 3 strain Oka vaccine]4XHJ_F Chain F, Envelope glycoprotein L [Human herpesvirus 3 strain Oka vaccine]4XI5_B Chain B, Envelope glycoprotein L [Human herpesvirus 3 strain Oka vaccine]